MKDVNDTNLLDRVAAHESRGARADWLVATFLLVGMTIFAATVNTASGVAAQARDTPAPIELASVTISIQQ